MKCRYQFKRYPKDGYGLFMFEVLDSIKAQAIYSFWQVSPIPAPRQVKRLGLANSRWHLDGVATTAFETL
jgi:hypothetical protein